MLKVLIAEDEPLSLQNLSGQMRDLLGADALIEGVANGREAVERARQIQPQLVLMDIEMPVMNGLDAAAIIHKAVPETHIVFLTAFDRFDYAVGAMRAGGTDYLVKPFDSAQITACLRKLNLLPKSRPAGSLPLQPADCPHPAGTALYHSMYLHCQMPHRSEYLR